MSSLAFDPVAVLPPDPAPIPPGVELTPAGLVEWLDPFSADFPGFDPDECPERPDVLTFEPDLADEEWWAAETRGGGWVEGQSSPFDLELRTDSALAWWSEHADPDYDDLAALGEAQERAELGLLF